jgi:O-antigen/teichoic acid export membrane protein
MKASIALRAVATSWAFAITNAAAGFVLAPYILHRIGAEGFGLWVLVTSLVGYYGLLDVGIRSSILRYVSRYDALGDHEAVNQVLSTAFYYYLLACVVIVLATLISLPWASAIFSVPPDLLKPFRDLFLMAGVIQGLTLPLMVFASALEAAGRYDQANISSAVCLVLRVVVVVWVLNGGGGFFAVGAATLLSQLLAYVIQVPLALRAHSGLSISPKWIRWKMFRNMFGYGSVSLAIGLADRLKERLYAILIGIFLTPVDVTVFSLPMKIIAFPVQGVGAMTEFVNPLSSQLEAHQDFAGLCRLSLLSAQSAFLTLLPLAAFLIVFGRELLTLWVGAQYASAYPLLVLVTLGMGAAATQCCAQSMLFGIERHKALIGYRMLESLSAALLGTIALKIWGLVGFAAVVAASLLLTSLVLVPRHLCRILHASLRQYIVQGCLKPCMVTIPTVISFVLWRRWLKVGSWMEMAAVLLVGSAVYGLTLLLVAGSQPERWLHVEVVGIVARRLLPARSFFGPAAAPALLSKQSSED